MVAITHPAPGAAAWRRPVRRHPAVVYRRRRLAVLGLAFVALALAVSLFSRLVGPADPADLDGRPVAGVTVVVQPGDTVWSIAASLAPGDDPRPVVDAIVAANGGSTLTPGQRLEVVVP